MVSTSSVGTVDATTISTSDSATSSNSSDAIQAYASEHNSFTDTNLEWNVVSPGSISFSGSVFEEKTIAAKPGGDHCGIISYTYDFTIDSFMDFSLNGTFGFDQGLEPTTGVDDFINYSLTGTSVTGQTTSGATTAFAETGSLGPGSYSLIFNMEMYETINNNGNRGGGFDGTFSLTDSSTSVPEPHSLSLVAIGSLMVLTARRRKRPRKQVRLCTTK